ncbi:MAG: hypothetical protein RL722_2598 [Pseudomonadota bacterium]|jgi:hypothetical protein
MIPDSSCPLTTDGGFTLGRFRVAPLVRRNAAGRYASAVSIRSGRGMSSHDRVIRFLPDFCHAEAANQFALTQGTLWLLERGELAGPVAWSLHPQPARTAAPLPTSSEVLP